METKPEDKPADAKPADTKPAAPAAAPATPAAKPAAAAAPGAVKPPTPGVPPPPPAPPKPMEPKALDEITEKYAREYYKGRVCWVEGVDYSVQIVSVHNANNTKPEDYGSTFPSILVKYTKYLPNNPMFALPRGAPGGVSLPKQFEKVPCVYKTA